jgi:hypothetical protein
MKEENTCLQNRVAIAESNAAEIYLQGALSDTHLGDCQTFYDWCRCTVGTLEHNIKRAVEAEARAEAAESIAGQLQGLVRTAREQLNDLLSDEDLDDEKLRAASEDLLPNMVDGFGAALHARQLALAQEGAAEGGKE